MAWAGAVNQSWAHQESPPPIALFSFYGIPPPLFPENGAGRSRQKEGCKNGTSGAESFLQPNPHRWPNALHFVSA